MVFATTLLKEDIRTCPGRTSGKDNVSAPTGILEITSNKAIALKEDLIRTMSSGRETLEWQRFFLSWSPLLSPRLTPLRDIAAFDAENRPPITRLGMQTLTQPLVTDVGHLIGISANERV